MNAKPPELVHPAAQWQSIIGSYADLQREAESWPTDERANEQVAAMLETCRDLFVHSYFIYEFGVVAVVWSTLALEAALRDVLGSDATRDDGLTKLIGKAQGRGWLSSAEAEALRAGAELRNRLTHALTLRCIHARSRRGPDEDGALGGGEPVQESGRRPSGWDDLTPPPRLDDRPRWHQANSLIEIRTFAQM